MEGPFDDLPARPPARGPETIRVSDPLDGPGAATRELRQAIEYVPTWVIVGVAFCLGIGTTIGYKRIVITVAEKIGKTHLTYAQGACAEVVAMATIGLADIGGLPVSTTHVLSSGVAGTMWANDSGIQMATDSQHRPRLDLDSSRRHAAFGGLFTSSATCAVGQ